MADDRSEVRDDVERRAISAKIRHAARDRASRNQIRHLLLAVVLIDRSDDVHTSAEASAPVRRQKPKHWRAITRTGSGARVETPAGDFDCLATEMTTLPKRTYSARVVSCAWSAADLGINPKEMHLVDGLRRLTYRPSG
jgi:hypothetical protein